MLNIVPRFLLKRDLSYEKWLSKIAMIIFFRTEEHMLRIFL